MINEAGKTLDSRQEIGEDFNSDVLHWTLSFSPLWWKTVSTLVMPILNELGDDSYALVVGGGPLKVLRSDGSLGRRALKSVLPGGVEFLRIQQITQTQPIPSDYQD